MRHFWRFPFPHRFGLISTSIPRIDKMLPYTRMSLVALFTVFGSPCLCVVGQQAAAVTERTAESADQAAVSPTGGGEAETQVQFSFDRVLWREVLDWLSKQSGLALHVTELPQGTFTYTDPGTYTISEAIDRLNMFLIPQGFSIVRSGSLLSVVDLNEPAGLQQLASLAELARVDDLEQYRSHQVVRCMIPLGELSSRGVVEELSVLQLMTEPKVMEGSNQLLITDTASRMLEIREIVASMRQGPASNKHVLRTLQLDHLSMEQFLNAARPHLGLEASELANDSLSISTDDSGTLLFVSGTERSISLLSELLDVIDQPVAPVKAAGTPQELRTHRVRGENLQAVYDVLVTILADRSIRLSMENATNSIVALAEEDVHQRIESTIAQMEGGEKEFAVVDLKSLDPYFAITLLDEMFELTSDDDDRSDQQLKIDADPLSRRLFIRGKKDSVTEIREVIERLDNADVGDGRRLVPLFGSDAKQVLQLSKSSWGGSNPIRDHSDPAQIRTSISERVVASQSTGSTGNHSKSRNNAQPIPEESHDTPFRVSGFVSTDSESSDRKAPPIRVEVTSQGIVIDSNDSEALEAFEKHVRNVASSENTPAVRTVVYYLKFSTADEATRLLADLLDGATSVLDSQDRAQLVNAVVGSPSTASWMGSYLRSSEGATVVSAGSLTVISDSRLNRLICMGNERDLGLIEEYLEVIDRDQSLTDIQIHGRSHVIELLNTRASEIIEVVREAYGERVAMSSEQRIQQQARQSSRDRGDNNRNEPEVKVQTSSNSEPQMTLAVHERSNSLIVTAPDALFQEVEQLVRTLDDKGAETVEVVWYPQGDALEAIRQAVSPSTANSRGRTSSRDSRSRN